MPEKAKMQQFLNGLLLQEKQSIYLALGFYEMDKKIQNSSTHRQNSINEGKTNDENSNTTYAFKEKFT